MREVELCRILGETSIVGSEMETPHSVVKSAGRVFKILELLDVLEHEALVCEISEVLDLPQSSTSVLLRSMVDMGYLAYNRVTRAFRLTTRIALLGHSVAPSLVGDGLLIQLAERLNARTGQLVAISSRIRTNFQYLHVVQARALSRSFVLKGMTAPLTGGASGLVLLAQLPDDEIKRIALRINVESDSCYHSPSLNSLMDRIKEVRSRGYAFVTEFEKFCTLGMSLPNASTPESLAITIGAANKLIDRQHEFVGVMLEEISRYGAQAETERKRLNSQACDFPSRAHQVIASPGVGRDLNAEGRCDGAEDVSTRHETSGGDDDPDGRLALPRQ